MPLPTDKYGDKSYFSECIYYTTSWDLWQDAVAVLKDPAALSTAWSLWSGSTCTDLGEEFEEHQEDS